MPPTTRWREAGIASILAAPLPLLLLPSPFCIGKTYAEQVLDPAAKTEARLKKVELTENNRLSPATAQLGNSLGTGTAERAELRNNLPIDQVKARYDPIIKLKEVTVLGKERGTSLIRETESASQGFIGQEQIKNRPLSRVGELVEFIPGMIATQHSGDGKANQYFLRGFNLDHGSDFAAFVDGVPINLPSHAHGQGYMDLNGLIPELIDNIQYGKGPYYADQGDFSAAGACEDGNL